LKRAGERAGERPAGTANFMATRAMQFSTSALRTQLAGLWDRLLRISRRAPKRLRLCESLPLGERRFVAVVQFEKTRFLVGGTSSSLVLLSRLQDSAARADDEAESYPPPFGETGEETPGKNRENEKC
jgi:hypothetical protein